MNVDVWIAFVIASSVMLAIPGPTVLLVVSFALGQGRTSGWATVPGVVLGDCTAMTVSLLGAGAVLAASATLFTILKLCGAAYLIWLGVKLWRSNAPLGDVTEDAPQKTKWSMFLNAYIVTALNPKSIVFFVAFVPQFIESSAQLLPQFILLEATFLILVAFNVLFWVFLAGSFRQSFAQQSRLKIMNRVGGSLLMGAGFLTAIITRN